MRPLEIAAAAAWWNANTSGKEEDFGEEGDPEPHRRGSGQPQVFAELKASRNQRKEIDDPILARAIDVLYLLYLEKQVDTALLKKMVGQGQRHREGVQRVPRRVDGKEMTDNEVRNVLKIARIPSAQGRLGGEQGGRRRGRSRPQGAGQAAQPGRRASSASRTSTPCSCTSTSRTASQLLKLFDELDELTRAAVRGGQGRHRRPTGQALQAQAGGLATVALSRSVLPGDARRLRRRPRRAVQEGGPAEAMCRTSTRGIGLPIDRVIASSDLYEKKGKSPHAFCTDIDREGDVRVLANIVPNNQWASTTAARVRPFGLQQHEHPGDAARTSCGWKRTS